MAEDTPCAIARLARRHHPVACRLERRGPGGVRESFSAPVSHAESSRAQPAARRTPGTYSCRPPRWSTRRSLNLRGSTACSSKRADIFWPSPHSSCGESSPSMRAIARRPEARRRSSGISVQLDTARGRERRGARRAFRRRCRADAISRKSTRAPPRSSSCATSAASRTKRPQTRWGFPSSRSNGNGPPPKRG